MKTLPPTLAVAGMGAIYGVGSESGKGGGSTTAAAPDPVAERRRERALKALDKKLAELRSSIRAPASGTGSPHSTSAVPLVTSVAPGNDAVVSTIGGEASSGSPSGRSPGGEGV